MYFNIATISEVRIKHFGFIDQPGGGGDCGPVSLPAGPVPPSALARGVLWVQKERYFARWKERFVIITRDYLQVKYC